MFYVDFFNQNNESICCANMPAVPRVGECIHIGETEQCFKIISVVYLSRNGHLITLPNGSICVEIIVRLLFKSNNRSLERHAWSFVILLWMCVLFFIIHALSNPIQRDTSPQNELIPGIGDILRKPTMPPGWKVLPDDPPPPPEPKPKKEFI